MKLLNIILINIKFIKSFKHKSILINTYSKYLILIDIKYIEINF